MARLNIFVFSVTFVIVSLNQLQVNGLLNITNTAINIGQIFIKEADKNVTYSSKKDINDRVKDLLRTIYKPYEKLAEDHSAHINYRHRLYAIKDNCLYKNFVKNIDDLGLFTYRMSPTMYAVINHLHFDDLTYKVADNWEKNRAKYNRMNSIHEAITTTCNPNLIDYLKDHLECKASSSQQLLYNAIDHAALLDADYYVSRQLHHLLMKIALESYDTFNSFLKQKMNNFKSKMSDVNMIEQMKVVEKEFIERNTKTLKIYKVAMRNANLEFGSCPKSNEPKSEELENVFKWHMVNEVDLNDKNTCSENCRHYQNTSVYGCYGKAICAYLPQCKGRIVGCGDDIAEVEVCYPDKDFKANYNHRILLNAGSHQDKECKPKTKLTSWSRGFYKCSYCMCTCEIHDAESDRYFDLRPITSNVEKNYVVTGVSFKKVNHVTFIQIQESKLLAGGAVRYSNLLKVNSSDYPDNVKANVDYHVISWDKGSKAVALDKIHSPGDKALTGLRLNYKDGLLKLQVQMTRFNFTTGQLFPKTSNWLSSTAGLNDRSELNIDKLNENDKHKADQYVQFQNSARFGGGQKIVPFIKISPVDSVNFGPMSGAGLYVENGENGAEPMLALKLLSFDVEPFVHV